MNPFAQDANNSQQQNTQQIQNPQVIEGTATEVTGAQADNSGIQQEFTQPGNSQQQNNAGQQQDNQGAQQEAQNVQQQQNTQQTNAVQNDQGAQQQTQNNAAQQNTQQAQNVQQQQNNQGMQQQNNQGQQQQNTQQGFQQNQNQQQNTQQGFQQQNNQVMQQQNNPPATQQGQMPMGGEVSFDDEIKLNKLEKLGKMRTDETRRVAFILTNQNGAPIMQQCQQFHDALAQRNYRAPEDPFYYKKYVEKFGEPKPRFGTIVVEYNCTPQGIAIDTSVRLRAWIFGQDKWPDLKQMHGVWGLGTIDLLMMCKDENFQKMVFQPTKDRYLEHMRQRTPDAYAQLLEEAQSLYQSKNFTALMGKAQTEQEIVAILNGASGAANAGAFGQAAGGGFGGSYGNPNALGGGASNPFATAPSVAGNGAAPGAAAFGDLVQN